MRVVDALRGRYRVQIPSHLDAFRLDRGVGPIRAKRCNAFMKSADQRRQAMSGKSERPTSRARRIADRRPGSGTIADRRTRRARSGPDAGDPNAIASTSCSAASSRSSPWLRILAPVSSGSGTAGSRTSSLLTYASSASRYTSRVACAACSQEKSWARAKPRRRSSPLSEVFVSTSSMVAAHASGSSGLRNTAASPATSGQRPGVGAHHRRAARHGFEQRQSETLVQRWQREHARVTVQDGQVVLAKGAEEARGVAHPRRRVRGKDRLIEPSTPAHDEQLRIESTAQ